MPLVETSASGVPAFVVESDGPARAALAFRTGSSDERLVTAGVTHLVEHLAMHALRPAACESNAFVDGVRTVFWVSGTAEEVADVLTQVAAALHDLPVDRLELERRVLLTEAARRGGAHAELLSYRFGPRTYGLRAYDEYGLRRLDGEDVVGWAAERFTAGNAALWSTVPLDDLALDLRPGARVPVVEPHTVDALPARFDGRTALGLDVVAPRSIALSTGWRVLQRRVHDVLRHEHAVVYDVAVDSERVGRDSRRFVLLTDPLPEVRYRAGRLLTSVLERLVQEGVSDDEVRRETELALRTWAEPAALLAAADVAALDTLLGVPVVATEQHRAEQAALTADQVSVALREALDTALVAVPDSVVTTLPLSPVARWSATWEPGRTFVVDPRVAQGSETAAARRMSVGEGGVTVAASADEPVSVAYRSCEAVLVWEDERRRLLGADGFSVLVLPWEWQDGDEAVALLDRAVPPELVVPMGPGEGPPPELAAPLPPAPPATRRRPGGRLGRTALFLLWLCLSVVLISVAFAPITPADLADAGPYAAYGCGRDTALDVLRDGPGPSVTQLPAPGGAQLAQACRREARVEAGLAVGGAVSTVLAVMVAVRSLRRAWRARGGRTDRDGARPR